MSSLQRSLGYCSLDKEIIGSCSENHMTPIKTLYGPTAKYWKVSGSNIGAAIASSVPTSEDMFLLMSCELLQLKGLCGVRRYGRTLWMAKRRGS